ncbi:hypothetical protein [Janthinobacterium sp. LB3P112]|uniref:hypothetical protein n=1 Tax=Janthinobacterium sp. LB3P112 TaxID=3424196 RepID=UPI003F25A372
MAAAQELPARCAFAALAAILHGFSDGHLKVCLKLLKDGKLLRQDRKLGYSLKASSPATPSYAQSGLCRCKPLLDDFGDTGDVERCCTCDNCQSPPALAAPITLDELPPAPAEAPASVPRIAVGSRVRVPR